jgi:hypothetical protein
MLELLSKIPDNGLIGFDNSFNTNEWLFKKGNFLTNYLVMDADGLPANCADIIQKACSDNNINQRAIIMTLQREQELIELEGVVRASVPDIAKEPEAMDWACGCAKYDDGSSNAKYKGFYNQIFGACETYKYWADKYEQDAVATLLDTDNKSCICQSMVTWCLINYTPHAPVIALNDGIWYRYFSDFGV